jgi:cation:H+ antiporter
MAMLTYVLLVLGFPLLLLGAHYLVVGSAAIAQRMGVSELVIGLTVVSLGTSAPELAVSVLSSVRDANDLALGNIVGSNVSNTLLIIGTAALLMPLNLQRATARIELPMALGATALLALLANDRLLFGAGAAELSRLDGGVLVAALLGFGFYVYRASLIPASGEEVRPLHPALAVTMVAAGAAGLALGGHWIVEGSVATARALGVSEALIGLTIVSVGTSLPELATSIVAARRGSADMAVGNVIGSNLINVLWILGVAALIDPIDFNERLNTDLVFLGAVTVLAMVIALRSRHSRIGRPAGALFLLLYASYLVFLVWRG